MTSERAYHCHGVLWVTVTQKGVVRSRMCPLKDGICHFSSLLSIVLAPCLWLVDGKVGLGTAGHLLSCLTAAAHHVRVLRWSAPVASRSFLTWGPCMCALRVQVPMWALMSRLRCRPSCFLRLGLSLAWNSSTRLYWHAGYPPASALLGLGLQMCTTVLRFFKKGGSRKSNLGSLCLCSKCFTN